MALAASNRLEFGRYGRLSLALLALGFGLLTLSRARHDSAGSFAGASTLGAIAELAAGWSLVAVGLLFWERHGRNLSGPLLVAAGFAWFLPEWPNPGIGSALGFTVGLIGAAACAPLVGHAALAYPTGRLKSAIERVTLAAAYSGAIVLLGALPASTFDPAATGCLQCPGNLALAHGDAGLNATFDRYGLRIGIAWLAGLAAALVWKLARSSRTTALRAAPVALPALAYLGLVLWDFWHSLDPNLLGNDAFDVRAWRYEALALTVMSLGVAWGLGRERRARGAVAQLVVELGRTPRPGAVRAALAEALGDPTLELAYRRPHSEDYVNATGLPVEPTEDADHVVTPLLRGDVPFAALVHDARLRESPGFVEEVVSAARIALQNEQLQAEIRAQLQDLRASRARIVETGDAERRRLERDLHDGAQQRIVALSLGLQLLRSRLGPDPDGEQEALISAAEVSLRQALAELRELAHGIYPAVLGDEGLAAALEAFAEQADAPVRIEHVVDGRFPTAAENAAYFTVVEAVRNVADARVSVELEEGRLLVRIRSTRDGAEPEWPEIADRVGALDGLFTSVDGELRAEIPCAS